MKNIQHFLHRYGSQILNTSEASRASPLFFFFTDTSSIAALSPEMLALAEPLAKWRSTNTKQPKPSCSPNTRRQSCTWGIFLPCSNYCHLFRMFFFMSSLCIWHSAVTNGLWLSAWHSTLDRKVASTQFSSKETQASQILSLCLQRTQPQSMAWTF